MLRSTRQRRMRMAQTTAGCVRTGVTPVRMTASTRSEALRGQAQWPDAHRLFLNVRTCHQPFAHFCPDGMRPEKLPFARSLSG